MEPKLGRLKARPEFLRVAAEGRKWTTPGLVLQAGRAARDQDPQDPVQGDQSLAAAVRVGFTVSRKVGQAVVRNRAKRRLRAAVAEVLPALGKPGTDYVLIGRQATPKRPYALLKADLAEALRRIDEPRKAGEPRRPGHSSKPGAKRPPREGA